MDRSAQYLLIGGGPASAFAARGIRQADDRGDITIVAGEQVPYDKVPYFFSDEFDLRMVLRGGPRANKETDILGDLYEAEFVELYPDDAGRLRMGLGVSREQTNLDAASDAMERLIRAQTPVAHITPEGLGLPWGRRAGAERSKAA